MSESSEGGVRHRTSVVCVHDDKLLTFLATDPTTGHEYLFLPGGLIEAGELPADCAIRETREETGYRVAVFEESRLDTHYDFRWDGALRACHTLFYRARLDEAFHEPMPVEDASYNHGVVWLPLPEILEKLNYHPAILDAVLQLVKIE